MQLLSRQTNMISRRLQRERQPERPPLERIVRGNSGGTRSGKAAVSRRNAEYRIRETGNKNAGTLQERFGESGVSRLLSGQRTRHGSQPSYLFLAIHSNPTGAGKTAAKLDGKLRETAISFPVVRL